MVLDMRSSPQEVYASEYLVMEVDEARSTVRIRRTAAPFPTSESHVEEWQALLSVIDRQFTRERYGLLLDLREAPSRNDPAFEQVAQAMRPRIRGGFRRTAVVVKTAAGMLQLRRFERQSPLSTPEDVFFNEEEALAFLRGA